MTRLFSTPRPGAGAGVLLLVLLGLSAPAATPKRVLILRSFGQEMALYDAAVSGFRTTLARELGQPVDIYEMPLDLARSADPALEKPFLDFLEQRLAAQPVDVIVPVGSPAARFTVQHRERLSASTPVVFAGVEQRIILAEASRANAAVIAQSVDLPGCVEDVLRIRPDTTNIAVVFGASPIEQYWAGECRREWQPFTDRVAFTWLDTLSLRQMQERVQRLPPRSFIVFGLLLVDAEGVPHEGNEALKAIHAAANAPIFGLFKSQFGQGIIGGRLYEDSQVGAHAARAAIRILRGESAASIPPEALGPAPPVYDWRELNRWGIRLDHLPADSAIEFRAPTFWGQYRWHIAGIGVFFCLQTALIIGLIVNRVQRRQAEAVATLTAELSSKFIHLPPGEVDREIMDAQRRICEVLGLDILALWQWSAGPPGSFTLTHYYSRRDGPQPSIRLSDTDFPWVRQLMLEGRIVPISSLDQMPAEAGLDRENTRRLGIKSNLTIPLSVGGEPLGVLGLNTTRAERDWPDALVERLQLVAQIFAHALARKRDVSALLNAHEVLQKSEQKFRELHESMRDAFVSVDLAGLIREFNSAYQQMLGYSPEELRRLSYHDLTPERWHAMEAGIIRDQVLTRGYSDVYEKEYRRKDGTEFTVELRTFLLRDESGRPAAMWAIVRDVTERKQAAAELQRHRTELAHVSRVSTMGALTASLAHEINQPLGAILNNAQAGLRFLTAPTPEAAEVRGALEDIARDTRRAGEVIRQLRALVRKDEPRLQPLDVNHVISEVVKLLHSDLVIRKVRVALELDPNLRPVSGDTVQLQQVVLNLVLNAFDSMRDAPEQRRRVTIRTRREAPALVRVEVRDRGTGLSPERLLKLFEPFRSTKRDGLGLGLSISHSIIEAHGGRLWAENNPECGATFYFTLPIHSDAASPSGRGSPEG